MLQLYKDIQTDFLSQIFRELFRFKAQSLLLGHPVAHQGPGTLQKGSAWPCTADQVKESFVKVTYLVPGPYRKNNKMPIFTSVNTIFTNFRGVNLS